MKTLAPADEAQRLEAPGNYPSLDTPPEQASDDLTLIAAHICEAPIVPVSLVDDSSSGCPAPVSRAVHRESEYPSLQG
jgi:hypothetical protein